MKKLFFIILISVISISVSAQLTMPAFFSSHMVLQRNKPIILWGNATAKKEVNINFNNQKIKVNADKNGKWKAILKPMQAGGPYILTVKSNKDVLSFSDILIGEVWLCSGQSNMAFLLKAATNATKEISNAHYPQIRTFNTEISYCTSPQSDVKGKWEVCSPQTAEHFSAVSYFFARNLYQKLKIPIGLIHSSLGGTCVETWTSKEALNKIPGHELNMTPDEIKTYNERIKENNIARTKLQTYILNEPGVANKWYDTNTSTEKWKEVNVPGLWSIKELASINGVVWMIYRVHIPLSCRKGNIELSLGPIDDDDVTWVNGHKVGQTTVYNVDRVYMFPAKYLKKWNTITVKVIDYHGGGGMFGSPKQLYIKANKQMFSLSGKWRYKISASDANLNYKDISANEYPSSLYNGMINPFVGLGLRGIIWYQGENNGNRPKEYAKLFPALINDWRDRWKEQLPFYWVQLPNYKQSNKIPSENNWAILRQSQTATLALPNTGQAITIDIGEANNIHPHNKQDVGKRLSLIALHNLYEYKTSICSGPTFKSVERSNNKLIISFDNVGKGLTVHNNRGEIYSITIAQADGNFQVAQARIKDFNKIVVWNNNMPNPVSVRYAWVDNPEDANIYNSEQLPAAPFQAYVQ